MLYIPSYSKYKKQQKGKSFRRVCKQVNFFRLQLGVIGLKAISCGRINSKEIKTFRQLIQKFLKKQGRLKIHIFPDTPITRKPLEVRMGKGKGSVNHWVFKVRPGDILFEIQLKSSLSIIRILKLVQMRLKIKTKIIFM